MARASAIWIAFGPNKVPAACFTVKHECGTWLVNTHVDIATIARYQDGVYDETITHWTREEFLAMVGR